MIHLACKVPNKVYIACSGGPDSMAAADFFLRGRKNITLLFFHHNTVDSEDGFRIVSEFARDRDVPLCVGRLQEKTNKEVEWRNARYKFFESVTSETDTVVTCHHLNDQIEQWLYSCIKGFPSLIPVKRGRYIRPFSLTPKRELVNWCNRKKVSYTVDSSNLDGRYARGYIRNNMIDDVYHLNPGIEKTVKKMIKSKFE